MSILEERGKMLIGQNQDNLAKLDRILNIAMELQTQNH